jgi:hypothetical protein
MCDRLEELVDLQPPVLVLEPLVQEVLLAALVLVVQLRLRRFQGVPVGSADSVGGSWPALMPFTKFFARVVKGIFSQIMNSDVLPVSLLPLSLCIVVPPTRTYRLGSRFHCAPPQHQWLTPLRRDSACLRLRTSNDDTR